MKLLKLLTIISTFISTSFCTDLPEVNQQLQEQVKDINIKASKFKFTYYWVANEKDYPLGSEVAIKKCGGGTLARVSQEYWKAVKLEGSGKLRDGKFINCGDDNCNCFTFSKPTGSKGDELKIYTSLAVNEYKVGTLVLINEFVNFKLPNGKKHNGCFKVVDESWSFDKKQIDLYVEEKKNYEKIQQTFDGDYVNATFNAKCNVLTY